MIGQQNKREDRKSDSLTNRQADKQIDRDRRDRDKTQTDKQKRKKEDTEKTEPTSQSNHQSNLQYGHFPHPPL